MREGCRSVRSAGSTSLTCACSRQCATGHPPFAPTPKRRRIELFLATVPQLLASLSEADFNDHLASLVEAKLECGEPAELREAKKLVEGLLYIASENLAASEGCENLRMLQGAPGVAMEQLPPNLELPPEPEADPDARGGGGSSSAPQHPAEHYDDD